MELLYNILKTIILSLFSATIFWLLFSYLPKIKRLKKIRPKVNQDLETITTNLYATFTTIFKSSRSVNIIYNKKILNGTLTKEDIEIGLLNKCFAIDRLDDFKYKSSMISIGEDLEKFKFLIIKKIDELYFFSEFLSTNEIITLEKIKKILERQNIESPYIKNLFSFTPHFNELYQLYLNLNKITFNKKNRYIQTNEFYDFTFPLYQIDYYFYNKKDYKNCRKLSKNYIRNFPSTKIFEMRVIMCEYELNRNNKGVELFKSLIKNEKHIIHYSNFINDIQKYDNRILSYLKKTFQQEKFEMLIESIEKNKNKIEQEKNSFIKTNEVLKGYFKH